MLITKLEMQQRPPHRTNLYVDGEFAFSVHGEVLRSYELREGSPIDEETLESVKQREQFHVARDSAMRLVGYRLRSEKELRLRLTEKEFDPAIVDEVVRNLAQAGVIDDRRFAMAYIHDLQLRKPSGRRLLEHRLRLRGIAPPLAEEALSEAFSADDERRAAIETAKSVLRRYRTSGKRAEPRAEQRRLAQFLARRGFSWDVILPVINNVFASTPSLPLE